MDGKGRDAGRDRDWADRMTAGLEDQVEDLLMTMAAVRPAPGDIADCDRKARCLANLARAVRAILVLRSRPRDRAGGGAGEDEINSDDDHDVDPGEFERARAELGHRLDRLRDTVEARRLEGWSVVPANAGRDPGGEDAGASASP